MSFEKTVIVCATAQKSSKTLVEAGKNIADSLSAKLQVVSVLPIQSDANKTDHSALEDLFQLSKENGGEMAVYFSDDPILTVGAHLAKSKPMTLVVGFPGENSNDFLKLIHGLFPEIHISMVDKEGIIYNILPTEATMSAKH